MGTRRELLKGCTETMVLKLISEKQMYGYEICQEIIQRSEGIFDLTQGTIYPLLYTLEKKGLIKGVWQESKKPGERRRKYYLLTTQGKKTSEDDINQWKQMVQGMNLILGMRHAPSV